MKSIAAVMLWTSVAGAHPVDKVVQSSYVHVASGELRVNLDITPGPEVSAAIIQTLDANGDQQFSAAEIRAYGERVVRELTVTLDGAPIGLTFDKASVPMYLDVLYEAATIRIYATAKLSTASGNFHFANRYQPAASECIANVITAITVTAQRHSEDGRQLDWSLK